MTKTVKMTCEDKTADVHPDEVDNMKAAGWSVVAQKKPAKKAVKS